MKGLSAWVVSLLAVAAASHCSSEDGPSIDAVTEGGVDSVDVAYDLPVEGTVCMSGSRECTGPFTFHVCDPDGSAWGEEQTCEEGTTCYEGFCSVPCERVEENPSSIGCLFYALDMDQWSWPVIEYDTSPYAIVASNVDDYFEALVSVQRRESGTWVDVEFQSIPPNSLYTFRLSGDSHVEDTGVVSGVAYRISSDYPIIAYQFNPIDTADQASNDASLLLPLHALDRHYYAVSWHQMGAPIMGRDSKGYVTVVGTADGTGVTVTPTVDTVAGGGVPVIAAGDSYHTNINDGDVLQIATTLSAADLSGTYIVADAPVAVFGGHECADVPYHCTWCRDSSGDVPGGPTPEHEENTCAWCDHLEEQVFPLSTWGTTFVASRVPVRSTGSVVEAAFWRVLASENATTVTIEERPGITLRLATGFTNPAVLDAGQYLDFEMVGSTTNPGDSLVSADKPILLAQYIEGQECTNRADSEGGDPALIIMVPVEQYLDDYVFLTPNTYDIDYVIVTRPEGAAVTLDSLPIPDTSFIPAAMDWEVARVEVGDGVHVIGGTAPFGIISVGYSPYVSYGYAGGMKLEVINPFI
jgi:hypothetical protein